MIRHQGLHKLFIEELGDIYHTENKMIPALVKLMNLASSTDLQEALGKHLEETKNQIQRLQEIFSLLKTPGIEKKYTAIEGLIQDAEDLIENKPKSSLLDATIISAVQKIEHYEIASYGSLRSFAKHLDLDKKIIHLLQETLDEESAADKKLTHIAEGSFFTSGINENAAINEILHA